MRFVARDGGEFLRIEVAHIGGVRFGPACRRGFLHRDRKFGVGLAIAGEEPARIAHRGLRHAAGENSGGDLPLGDREIAGAFHGASAIFRSERGGWCGEAIHFAIFLFAGHREQARIFGLAMRERKRRFDRGAQRILIDAICRRARGAPVDDGANRNGESSLGDVLMNCVVREAGQRVVDFIDVDFGLVGFAGFREAQNIIDDGAQFALGEQAGGAGRCYGGFSSALDDFARGAHDFANAVPMRTLRNRDGDAPWPVPIVCIGWPLPQFGVPHKTHSSAPQIASHEFQNSVVMPL